MRLSDGTARVPQNRTRSERIAAKSRAAASEAPLPSTRSAAHKRDVEGCNRRICRNDDRSQWLKLTLSPKQKPRRAFQLAGVLILETSFFGTAKTIPGRGGDRYPVDGPCIRGRPGSLGPSRSPMWLRMDRRTRPPVRDLQRINLLSRKGIKVSRLARSPYSNRTPPARDPTQARLL